MKKQNYDDVTMVIVGLMKDFALHCLGWLLTSTRNQSYVDSIVLQLFNKIIIDHMSLLLLISTLFLVHI